MPSFEFTVPARTTQGNPTEKVYNLSSGVLNVINVMIPDGHKGLARLQIEANGGTLLAPTPGSDPDWMRGNGGGYSVTFDPPMRLPGSPWSIRCTAWNADLYYPHTFFIEVK